MSPAIRSRSRRSRMPVAGRGHQVSVPFATTPAPHGNSRPWWQVLALGAGSLALGVGGLVALWLLAHPLALLLAAIVLAQALSPVVGQFERWLPRSGAAMVVSFAVFIAVGVVITAIARTVGQEAAELVRVLPSLLADLQERVERWDPSLGMQLLDGARTGAGAALAGLIALPFSMLSFAVEALLVFVLAVYWMIATPRMQELALSLVPPTQHERISALVTEMGQTMGGYVRAILINAGLLAAVTYVGLLLIGVEYPLVLALIAGISKLLPVVGRWIGAAPAIAAAFLSSPMQALVVLIFFVVIEQIEAHLVLPNIMRHQTDIPPLLVVLALLAGGLVGGILGAMIAIPVAGALRVLILRELLPLVRRWSGTSPSDGSVLEQVA